MTHRSRNLGLNVITKLTSAAAYTRSIFIIYEVLEVLIVSGCCSVYSAIQVWIFLLPSFSLAQHTSTSELH